MVELMFPVLLGGSGPYNVEVLYSSNYLDFIPYRTIKKESMLNALIYEGNGNCYRIKNISTIGRKTPWWYLSFGNPLMKVSIEYVKEEKSLIQMKRDILNSIKHNIEYWEDAADYSQINDSVDNAQTLRDVILYLSSLIYNPKGSNS